MRNFHIHLVVSLLLLSLPAGSAWAWSSSEGRVSLLRDQTYEQNLRFEASADKTVPPAKVIRWLIGRRGRTLSAPSTRAARPLANAHDGHIRLIAGIAFTPWISPSELSG